MNKYLKNKYFILLCRTTVALVFIFAGASKINDAAGFAVSISNYRILPDFLINITAIILPWIEIIAGILFLFGIYIKENALILNSLLGLFILMIMIAVIRGLDIECGCFGTNDAQQVGLLKIAENVFLLFAGLNVYFFKEKDISDD